MTDSSARPAAHAVPGTALPSGNVPRKVRSIFIVNLVVEIGIIVTGGLVRLTKSGLGCPTWPQCVPGSFVPTGDQAEGIHKVIEFGNRTLSFVVAAAAIALLWAVYKKIPHRRALRLPAWGVLGGILFQAVLGGITVRMALNPVTVSLHFLASAFLVALSTYLLVRLDEGDGPARALAPPIVMHLSKATAALFAVVLVLGTIVTGAGPHSGDADMPVRYGLDLRVVSWLHADSVMVFVGLVVALWIACHLVEGAQKGAHAWRVVFFLSVTQGALGFVQYALGLYEVLVLAHMLLASLLVATITWATLSLRHREVVPTTSAGAVVQDEADRH
ncbi:COX15/CtaA family protein [Gephyromycinifex aptenodytis]|uniref:COX15/CtaA family protein n=1 Tax=Gephyromycinifex aptenodytis TaxID=2716227 RepID=UPI001D032223|nr:COX15/CtaA family protein [Gephyromycinifex aptenodytis]